MSWFVVATEVGGTAAADVGVTALGSEFGTAALFSELGAGGISSLMGMGAELGGAGGISSLLTSASPEAASQLASVSEAAQTANIGQQTAQFGQTQIPSTTFDFRPPPVDFAPPPLPPPPLAEPFMTVPVEGMGGAGESLYGGAGANTAVQPTLEEMLAATEGVDTAASGVYSTAPTVAETMAPVEGMGNSSLYSQFANASLPTKLLLGSLGLTFLGNAGAKRGPEATPYTNSYDASKHKATLTPQPVAYTPQYTNYRRMAEGGQTPSQSFFSAPFNNAPTAPMQTGGQAMRTGLASLQPNDLNDRYAQGGLSHLGSYSDGGRMLKGPGDGMSDSIPATINNKQPARLANDEFVVPADVVSHLGNGSSDAGAKQLYKMMDKVRQARTGTKRQGKQINPSKYLPTR